MGVAVGVLLGVICKFLSSTILLIPSFATLLLPVGVAVGFACGEKTLEECSPQSWLLSSLLLESEL